MRVFEEPQKHTQRLFAHIQYIFKGISRIILNIMGKEIAACSTGLNVRNIKTLQDISITGVVLFGHLKKYLNKVIKMEPMKILDFVVERYKNILGENLVGVYLHGSLAMGCYTAASDIDFIALVKEPIDMTAKKAIIQSIIHLKDLPEKGIEMSIVLDKYAKEFVYPTPFELHYSDAHKDKYISDCNYICGEYTDKDLAAHFTMIKHKGICLYGKRIEEAFNDIPAKYYIDSIRSDVENAEEDIIENTVYIALNLCRVLYYIRENIISSKLEAGNWAKEEVPQQYRKIVEDAVKVYSNQSEKMEYNKESLIKYADYMLEEIEKVFYECTN